MNTFARHLAACLLLLLVSGPGTALAKKRTWFCGYSDDRESPPSCPSRDKDDPVSEVEHRVEARLEGDLVHLTVHRTFHNSGQHPVERRERLELPRDGTVHGFALESQGTWTEGVLLPSTQAWRRYASPRRKGSLAPRTIALLSAADEAVELHLWNVPPRASVTVRYDVRVRLGYTEGRSFFAYPPARCEQGSRPSLSVLPPYPGAEVLIEKGDTEQQLDVLVVSWKARPFSGLDARAGLVPSGTGWLGFLQVRAGRMSEPPSHARVVFVVDASHSVGPRGLAEQLERAGRYLQSLPDAVAEGVVFRRSAERLFGRFVPASEWKAALAAVPTARLAPGNGSHLDEGLKLAQQVLTEGSGPARVLAFTDGQLRRAFEPVPPAPTTSAPEATVHLWWLPHRLYSEHPKLSGPLVRDSCGLQPPPPHATLDTFLRPLKLDQVRIEDDQGTRLSEPGTLEEGEGFQLWLSGPRTPPRRLVLRGRSWGCPVSLPVEVDSSLSADLGRTAHAWDSTRSVRIRFGKEKPVPSEGAGSLAMAWDWVSPARSFLAVPSGAGPSSARTRALPEGVLGGIVQGLAGGIIPCSVGAPPRRKDEPGFIEELTRLFQPAVAACLQKEGSPFLQVRVETTGDELVDVEVTGAASEAQATCVREATWALRLPALFADGYAASYTLTPRPRD